MLEEYQGIIHQARTEEFIWVCSDGMDSISYADGRQLEKRSYVLEQPTLVIDDAHSLYTKSKNGFDDLIQLLRTPAFQSGTLKVILLSSEMDFEDLVRRNGMPSFVVS